MTTDPLLSTLIATWRLGADITGRPEEYLATLRRLGYDVSLDSVLAAVPGAAEIQELLPVIEAHASAVADGVTVEELLAALEIVPLASDVVDAIATADLSDLEDLAGGLAFDMIDIGLRWPQLVLFDAIEEESPWFVVLLELVGLVSRARYSFASDDGTTLSELSSVSLTFEGLGSLVADPAGHFTDLLVDELSLNHQLITDWVARTLGSVVNVEYAPADADYIADFLGGIQSDPAANVATIRFQAPEAPVELRAIELVIGPARPGNDPVASQRAMAVAFRELGFDTTPIELDASASLTITTPDLSPALVIDADGSIEFVGGIAGVLGATLDVDPSEPWRLFGSDSGPRLELGGLDAGLTYSPIDEDIELSLGLQQLSLNMGEGGTDSFLASLVNGVAATVDLGVTVSATGVRFDSSGQLTVRVPTSLTIGPIEVSAIEIGIDPTNGELKLSATTDVAVWLGPIQVSAAGVGLSGTFASGDSADAFGLTIGLQLPHSVAFGFETSEFISGGGSLGIDVDAGRYSGGAALNILEIGVSALTVIDTKLPGDPDGWAFFLSLGIDIPGLPLGFGFTLEGLGGLVALNRGIDADALAAGLREGAVDAILFPDDAVRDAALLIPQIDEYFPLQAGNTVIGPVVEVGWGMPVSLLTGQVGVMISLPEGLIVIMGSLSAALPLPDAPLLEINMDSLGVIDLAEGTILVTASLYDSRLLGTIELSGDMAFYLTTSQMPFFALSVGGWHPGFQPPDSLPTVFSGLRRIRAEVAIADNVSASFDSYFAVTSNTIQFGGEFNLEASVKVALVTYRAVGCFGFDVLIVFTPFKLVADVTAGVGIFTGKKELMGVDLGVHVEGPDPWFGSGYASFKFLGIKVKFEFSVGGKAAPEVAPLSNLLELIAEQLASGGAWSSIEPTGIRPALVLTSSDDSILFPDSRLVVQQTVAPLGRPIEKHGTNRVAQNSLSLAAANLIDGFTGDAISVETETITDWFAPSQFDEMSSAAKLSSPNYEEMEAGVSFGVDGVAVPESTDVPTGHETKVWVPPIEVHLDGVLLSLGLVGRNEPASNYFSVGAKAARNTGLVAAQADPVSLSPVQYHQAEGQQVPTHVGVADG